MSKTLIDRKLVDEKITAAGLSNLGKATIREIVGLVNVLQQETGVKYMRMEMGVPGLKPSDIGTNAEIDALHKGVAADYPMVDGLKELKEESSRFVKNFMNIEISPTGCIPTVGSMQGGYATFLINGFLDPAKDTALFIDPGFPVQKQQFRVLGQKFESFDVYHYRGEKLHDKLKSYLEKGNINSIIYSNPNNPAWFCLTEEELKIIGDLCNQYDVIAVEDLAYFAMDFRRDMSKPGQPPYQLSVANFTNNYVLLISGSKAFSYAGQRIAVVCISDAVYNRSYPELKKRFGTEKYGYTFVLRIIYSLSSGAGHSAQYALAAMFKAANEGRFNFVEEVREYGERAAIMKKLFLKAGFTIVYDKDLDEDLADGFYFTVQYPGLTGHELLKELLAFGISAITLENTGSEQIHALRACVSQIKPQMAEELERRLNLFAAARQHAVVQ